MLSTFHASKSSSGGCEGANSEAVALPAVPLLILQCDQYGILHAPCGLARSLLTENGYGNVQVAVHNTEGQILFCSASELLP